MNPQNAGCIGPDGQVYCHHDVIAVRRTSNTLLNPNRDFYACPKEKQCSFFRWADDPILRAMQSATQTAPSQPRPFQGETTEQARSEMSTPKRPPPSAPETPKTPAEIRLEKIKAALFSSQPSPTDRFQVPESLPTLPGASRHLPSQPAEPSSPASLSSHSPDVFDLWPPECEDSDQSISRSSKRPKRSHTPEPVAGPSTRCPPTPPPTTQRSRPRPTHRRPEEPQTPTKSKGNGKQRASSEDLRDEFLDDGDEAFYECAAQLHAASTMNVPVTSAPSSSTYPITDTDWTPDSVAHTIQHLASLPAYVQKLERRLVAAEKSAESKARWIEALKEHDASIPCSSCKEHEERIRLLQEKLRTKEDIISALKVAKRY